jgi:hypothetical protein
MKRFPWLVIVIALLLIVSPLSAAEPLSLARFWVGFKSFWGGVFSSVGGVVGVVLLTGAVGIFIITRGKWLK